MQKTHAMADVTSLSGIAKTSKENLINECQAQYSTTKKHSKTKPKEKILIIIIILLFLTNHIGKSLELKVQDCLTPVKR